jgi:hypothetical protein
MTISALPPITYPIDKTLFPSQVDAFIPALSVFVTEANAMAAALNFASTNDTSATSNTVGTGAKTFTVSASKSFAGGMYLVIADTAAPSTNSMYCQVTSYSGTTLVVSVISVLGSGTKTAWTISQSSLIAGSTIYTRANILGTVSQSAGVPTGAIMEYISNANGEAWRFACGMQICTTIVVTGYSATTPFTRTFAASFIATPGGVSINNTPVSAYDVDAMAYATTTGATFYSTNTAASNTVVMTAIGRWF